MKSKTLIAAAVASTFGLATAAFAGAGHEVMTPSSPNESLPSAVLSQHHGFHSDSLSSAMAPSESLIEATGHDLALSDTSDWSASYDQMAEADIGDVYLIGFAPMDSWDYYVLDDQGGDTLALIDGDTYYLVPFETVALVTDDGYSMSQEDQVSWFLSEYPMADTAEVG
jgi:hypothetical protein